MMMRKILTGMCMGLPLLLIGCSHDCPQWKQIKTLEQEKIELTMRTDQLTQENQSLRQQIATLSGLDSDVRLDQLDTLTKIKLGKRTGLYDDSDTGQKVLRVYIEPMDAQQDYIKAVGTLTVELWNLGAAPTDARLAAWIVEPDDLQQHWGGTIFASYYRLSFPTATVLTGQENTLTVKAAFTDLLSGKVLRDQTTVAP